MKRPTHNVMAQQMHLATRRWMGLILAGLSVILVVAGCRDSGPGSRVFVRNGTGQRLRIAVIPFASPGNLPEAGQTVTNTVITYLLATGAVEVVEPGVVDKAMRAARFVPEVGAGLDPDTLAALQQQLQVDAYLLGNVEEYGDVRIGPDSYPAVSFSARLVRASDATILWAASISRTGADSVKIFDIGRVSSLGKLTKSAVAEMANSLRASALSFSAPVTPAPGPAGSTPSPTTTTTLPPAGTQVMPVTPRPTAPANRGPAPGAKTFALDPVLADESRSFGEADLKALLAEVPNYTRGQVGHTKHAFDTVTALYTAEAAALDVRLVDYQKVETAKGFVTKESDGLQPEAIDSQTAFLGGSPAATPGVLHLNIAAGRFGLYVIGPEAAGEKMRQLAIALIQAK